MCHQLLHLNSGHLCNTDMVSHTRGLLVLLNSLCAYVCVCVHSVFVESSATFLAFFKPFTIL